MSLDRRLLIFRRAQVLRASLYGSQRRHDLKGIPKALHSKIKTRLSFTARELAEWLERKSVGGMGVVWRCHYGSGPVLTLGKITIDHYVPISQGGATIFDNFALTSSRTNRIKGPLRAIEFRRLQVFVSGLSPDSRVSIMNRLAQPPHALMNEFRRAGRK